MTLKSSERTLRAPLRITTNLESSLWWLHRYLQQASLLERHGCLRERALRLFPSPQRPSSLLSFLVELIYTFSLVEKMYGNSLFVNNKPHISPKKTERNFDLILIRSVWILLVYPNRNPIFTLKTWIYSIQTQPIYPKRIFFWIYSSVSFENETETSSFNFSISLPLKLLKPLSISILSLLYSNSQQEP